MFGQFMSAFEEFKHTNDNRLQSLEKRGNADPLIGEKLDRIDRALDGYKQAMDRKAVDLARPVLDAHSGAQPDEYKEAFAAYVRRGEEKALSVGSNPDGGYLVQLAGVDLPGFHDQSAMQLIMESLAVIFLRRGVQSAPSS